MKNRTKKETGKRIILSTDDPSFEEVNERIVIKHDESSAQEMWPRDEWDHSFVLWSNMRDLRGDKNAECPFEKVYDDEGFETDEQKKKDGYIVYPVSVYEHSGYAFALGNGSGFPDFCWDVTSCGMYLYTNREIFEKKHGKGSFDKMTEDDFCRIASGEVEEMNLASNACWFCWEHERKRTWTKTYSDGTTDTGYDWETVDSCGGYLTDDSCAITGEFDGSVPVYSACDWFEGDNY